MTELRGWIKYDSVSTYDWYRYRYDIIYIYIYNIYDSMYIYNIYNIYYIIAFQGFKAWQTARLDAHKKPLFDVALGCLLAAG